MKTSTSFVDSSIAEVVEAIAPNYRGGRIAFQCTFWPARYAETIYGDTMPCGSSVKVVGRDGLTQLVVPI